MAASDQVHAGTRAQPTVVVSGVSMRYHVPSTEARDRKSVV